MDLLEFFHNKGFVSILVHFDIPDQILRQRVDTSQRSKAIFRSATSFEEVLTRQLAKSHKIEISAPIEGEADYLFVIKNTDEVESVSRGIVKIAQNL